MASVDEEVDAGHECRGAAARPPAARIPVAVASTFSRDLIEAADERARLDEPEGYGLADPAPGASDQRDTTAQ